MSSAPVAARPTSRTTAVAVVLPLLALAGFFALGSEANLTELLSSWTPHMTVSLHGVDHSDSGAGARIGAAGAAAAAVASSSPRPPRLHLVLRTYAQDRSLFYSCFNRSMESFLDWRNVHLSILLDADSEEDAAFGAELVERLVTRGGASFQVRYLDPPSPAILALRPSGWTGTRYSAARYTRMLWDSFFLDTWLPEDSVGSDVLGVIDTDAPLMALLPPVASLLHRTSDPLGSAPLLRAQAKRGDEYPLDSVLLGAPSTFSTMDAGSIPQFFFVRTFAALREHVTRVCNASSFEEALVAAVTAAPPTTERAFSPANMLLSYAATHELERYAVSVHGEPGAVAVAAFGFNKVCVAGADFVLRRGCCRAFRTEGCMPAELSDFFHVTTGEETRTPPFPVEELRRVADEVYDRTVMQVASLSAPDRARMAAACAAVTNRGRAT